MDISSPPSEPGKIESVKQESPEVPPYLRQVPIPHDMRVTDSQGTDRRGKRGVKPFDGVGKDFANHNKVGLTLNTADRLDRGDLLH